MKVESLPDVRKKLILTLFLTTIFEKVKSFQGGVLRNRIKYSKIQIFDQFRRSTNSVLESQ